MPVVFPDVRIESRDYQRRVVARAIEMFTGPHVDRRQELPEARSVIVESPTGSGKTVMGLLIAKWAQETLGMRVVWSAMRRNLLTQVERENRDRGFGVDLAVVSMFEKSPPRADLLIVDEAHHDATRSMASLHAAVGPAKVLGLTAYEFKYKGDDEKRVGFMAQDVQKVLPEAVEERTVKGKKRLAIKPAVIGAALAQELTQAKAA
jgi:superfamily II DNA or RNA helicase